MPVIAKFYNRRVATIEERWGHAGKPVKRYEVNLDAVSDGSDENKMFWKWTPNGRIELVASGDAGKAFVEGLASGEFYVTFERVASIDAVPKDALAFRVIALGNEHGDEKIYTVKMRCINQRTDIDVSGTIDLGTINREAAKEFLGFDAIAVRFQPASTPAPAA